MKWEAWVLVAFYVASVITSVATIGRKRQPTTPTDAAVGVAAVAVSVFLVVRLGVS